MDYPIHLKLPIELESPIEFILVGPFGTERGVLVQSTDAKVDLVAHAQKEQFEALGRSGITWWKQNSTPAVISCPGIYPDYVSKEFDGRPSELTLVWRSEGGQRSLDEPFRVDVQSCLSNHSADLIQALFDGSRSRVIWAVAEVVELCRAQEALIQRKRLMRSGVLWLAVAAYFAAGLVALYKFLV